MNIFLFLIGAFTEGIFYRLRGSSSYFRNSVFFGTVASATLLCIVQVLFFGLPEVWFLKYFGTPKNYLNYMSVGVFVAAWMLGESIGVGHPIGRVISRRPYDPNGLENYEKFFKIGENLTQSVIVRAALYGLPLALCGFIEIAFAVFFAWPLSLYTIRWLDIKDDKALFGFLDLRWSKFEFICGVYMFTLSVALCNLSIFLTAIFAAV